MALIFLSTFSEEILIRAVYIAILLVSGILLNIMFRQYKEDENISGDEWRVLIRWMALSLMVIFSLSYFVPVLTSGIFRGLNLSNQASSQLFLINMSFGILIAVAEEQLFRGFVTNLLVVKLNNTPLGIILSGLVFGIYHLAVYGTSLNNLFIVVGGGMILSYAAWRTGRVSTTMLAHVINNLVVII